MGRPLKASTLEKMELKATTLDGEVTLGKQVGYNKYIIEEEPRKIAVLATELVEPYDAIMTLKHGRILIREQPLIDFSKRLILH